MEAERKPAFRNLHIFGAISDSTYERMSEDMAKNVHAKPDGNPGTINVFDPEHKSFKDAMISIVFSCI